MKRDLEQLRMKIAALDKEILQLSKKRMLVADEVGKIKRSSNIPVVNYVSEASVFKRAEAVARDEALDLDFAHKLVSTLVEESIRVQTGPQKNRAEYLYSMFEKAESLESKGRKTIRLDVGEPDITAPQELKNALRDSLYGNDHIGYVSSKGLLELREAVVSIDLEADQVLITPGGKFAIFSAILAMISQQDRALIPEPTWPVYGNIVRLVGGREDVLHTRLEDSWSICSDKLFNMLQVHPKLMILCSPNNPSGKVFGEKELTEIVEAARKSGTYMLTDEVYESYSSTPIKSILQLADSKFIYVNTFSKRYGMTGWRIGYAISDKETINRMQSVLQLSITCVPEFIQKAAMVALRMEQKTYDEYAKKMQNRIDIACRELDKQPVKYVRPEGGMYVYPRVEIKGFNSEVFAHKLLDDTGVAVTPGEAFGDYPEHLRISLGTNIEEIREGIRIMGGSLQEWPKK
jgi:aspartate aminotransferase